MISFTGGLVLGYVVGSVITALLIFVLWRGGRPAAPGEQPPPPLIDLRDPADGHARRRRRFHIHR